MLARVLPLGVVFLIGCGQESTGVVNGKVRFTDGAPIPSGTIAFRNKEGKVDNCQINDGAYSMARAPLGKVKITVQTFPPSPSAVPPDAKPGSIKIPSLRYEKVSESYASFETTPLEFEVKTGTQEHNIDVERPKK